MKLSYISVVLLNYNGKQYLEKTLPPILNLNYPNYEIIVVDNGSDDGSIDYLSAQKNIKLIKSPRFKEKNFACNYAITQAKGEFILLLDNDIIIIDENILKKLLDFLKKLTNPGAIGLAVHDDNIPKSSRYGSYFSYYFIREVKKYTIEQIKQLHENVIPATGGQIFIKKELWQQIGGYDDHLKFGGDDNDLGIRLTLLGYNNYLYSETNQIHIGINERIDNKKYMQKFSDMFYAHLYTITKNYNSKNLIPSLIIYTGFTFLKAIKQSVKRKNAGPLSSFLKGLYLYSKNLKIALKKRKIVQSQRLFKHDIFLKIKPPRINK
ncbi:MAG: glycosyltransferase [Spirochaetota bacterium]